MNPVVTFKKVGKRFRSPHGDVDVLHDLDFAMSEGEFIAITGPSGSGKSTFLNLTALLDRPTTGEVIFDGRFSSLDYRESLVSKLRKRHIGMVFQNYSLLRHRSALDNVQFRFRYMNVRPAQARHHAREALDRLDIGYLADRKASLLSGGEMQRVAIARAVAGAPKLLVADEPTGNLDEESTKVIMDCFRELNEDGLTILLVTHNLALLKYCSRHLACLNGRLHTQPRT